MEVPSDTNYERSLFSSQ